MAHASSKRRSRRSDARRCLHYGPTEGTAIRQRDSQDGAFINAHPVHDSDGQQSIEVDGTTFDWNDGGPTGSETGVTDKLNWSRIPPLSVEDPYNGQDNLVELTDGKPGDAGQITFTRCLRDNPGFICLRDNAGYIWLALSDFSEDVVCVTVPPSRNF